MKKIYCVMTEDECDAGSISMGCFDTEEKAQEALDYWNTGDYSYNWIAEHTLYKNFSESMKEFND